MVKKFLNIIILVSGLILSAPLYALEYTEVIVEPILYGKAQILAGDTFKLEIDRYCKEYHANFTCKACEYLSLDEQEKFSEIFNDGKVYPDKEISDYLYECLECRKYYKTKDSFIGKQCDEYSEKELYVRLPYIKTPGLNEKCIDSNGKEYACGIESKNYLASYVKDQEVACYNKIIEDLVEESLLLYVLNCKIGYQDLSKEMLSSGYADTNKEASEEYVLLRDTAKTKKLGIHR